MADERLCECFGDSGLHASTHVRCHRGSDRECCDLCGWPVQPGAVDVLTAVNADASLKRDTDDAPIR